jgi:predicted TIM-barrel fold metal-dependent hydrolase
MSSYDGPIIDVDIHHRPKLDSDIQPYLSPRFRHYLDADRRAGLPLRPPQQTSGATLDSGGRRADAFPEIGPAGSDYTVLRQQLLDRYDVVRGLLTHDLGEFATHLNQYYAQDLCRAMNDWNIDTWLGQDSRLCSVVIVPSATPEQSAEEIRRIGEHPQLVGVLMSGNPLGRPLGDPLFHPIYEAAAELGLAICVHPAGGDRPNTQVTSVGGTKAVPLEFITQMSQQAMHYVSSLVVHGVFEKFPTLQWVINEYGIAWLPSLMWRLDARYAQLRRESPWVKDLPSEYIRRNVKLSTQPLEPGPRRSSLSDVLEVIDGMDRLLCFSTDYPHISMDDPTYVARLLPRSWHSRIFAENACDSYGWTYADLDVTRDRRSKEAIATRA